MCGKKDHHSRSRHPYLGCPCRSPCSNKSSFRAFNVSLVTPFLLSLFASLTLCPSSPFSGSLLSFLHPSPALSHSTSFPGAPPALGLLSLLPAQQTSLPSPLSPFPQGYPPSCPRDPVPLALGPPKPVYLDPPRLCCHHRQWHLHLGPGSAPHPPQVPVSLIPFLLPKEGQMSDR